MQPSTNLDTPRRALAVGAHPDDVEFGCGATLAKWAAAGCEILHLICTDGSKGTWDPGDDVARLVATRQQEQRNASRALGGKGEAVFLGWPDGELTAGMREQWQIAYWIRKFRPHAVLGHDPWRRYRLHPDHRNAGFLVTDGIVSARDPHFFPEQELPHHRPDVLLLWEAEEPDHVEDVGEYIDKKLDALMAHRSQFRSTMGIDDDDTGEQLEQFRQRVTQRLAAFGEPAGIPYGEGFKIMRHL